jgi:orotate phosphoribosyltransferase
VPARSGHFVLESGYHTDLWLELDTLFLDPGAIASVVEALADRLRPYSITAVCGPLLGGAFLAQALATRMGLRFYAAEPAPPRDSGGLFSAEYRLPPGQRRQAARERFAVVDEVISAGSSVRAAMAALAAAGGQTLVVGTLLLLGHPAAEHFSTLGLPLVALARRDFNLWNPVDCPRCRTAVPLENPIAPLS